MSTVKQDSHAREDASSGELTACESQALRKGFKRRRSEFEVAVPFLSPSRLIVEDVHWSTELAAGLESEATTSSLSKQCNFSRPDSCMVSLFVAQSFISTNISMASKI